MVEVKRRKEQPPRKENLTSIRSRSYNITRSSDLFICLDKFTFLKFYRSDILTAIIIIMKFEPINLEYKNDHVTFPVCVVDL